MQTRTKSAGYTLVEMLVATAVGAIVIAGAYSSFILVANQHDKIKDVADMQGSGRGAMRIMERDIRMAGFTWRDNQAKVIYGSIATPVTVTDSGNSCCDSISVVYDYHDESDNSTERVSIRYWVESYTGSKGTRGRLYRNRDVVLPTPKTGTKDVVADYVEDLQFPGYEIAPEFLYVAHANKSYIMVFDPATRQQAGSYISNGVDHDVSSMVFGPGGLLYVAHANKSYIMVFDPATRQQAGSYIRSGLSHNISSMVFKETAEREQNALVPIVLVAKTKKQYGPPKRYQTKDYFAGNYKMDKTDGHRREEFSTAVLSRNLAL